MNVKLCHCGRPLHYSDPRVQAMIEHWVDKFGEFVPVTVGDRTWMVSRHFIALHGLKAEELPSLGFKEK